MIDIPLPPSTNNLYRNVKGKGRVRSTPYREWQAVAGWELKMQKPIAVLGPYIILIKVSPQTLGDLSNRIKAIEDLLVMHLATPDDSKAWGVFIVRDERVLRGRAQVTAYERSEMIGMLRALAEGAEAARLEAPGARAASSRR